MKHIGLSNNHISYPTEVANLEHYRNIELNTLSNHSSSNMNPYTKNMTSIVYTQPVSDDHLDRQVKVCAARRRFTVADSTLSDISKSINMQIISC